MRSSFEPVLMFQLVPTTMPKKILILGPIKTTWPKTFEVQLVFAYQYKLYLFKLAP